LFVCFGIAVELTNLKMQLQREADVARTAKEKEMKTATDKAIAEVQAQCAKDLEAAKDASAKARAGVEGEAARLNTEQERVSSFMPTSARFLVSRGHYMIAGARAERCSSSLTFKPRPNKVMSPKKDFSKRSVPSSFQQVPPEWA
jgi:hypothetical protein